MKQFKHYIGLFTRIGILYTLFLFSKPLFAQNNASQQFYNAFQNIYQQERADRIHRDKVFNGAYSKPIQNNYYNSNNFQQKRQFQQYQQQPVRKPAQYNKYWYGK